MNNYGSSKFHRFQGPFRILRLGYITTYPPAYPRFSLELPKVILSPNP